MESFDGSRRRDSRSPLSPAERRSLREPEPLEQRLDRWMSTGRQLVEGVSGGRPGSRQGSRRTEGRQVGRGGLDNLGRWVENRLDWLLDDSDDWPEPWQQSERRSSEPPATTRRRGPDPAAGGSERRRRPLQAISRRGMAATDPGASGAAALPARGGDARAWPVTQSRATAAIAGEASPADGWSGASEDWPDDASFSVPRWQRPTAAQRRPDPLQADVQRPDRDQADADRSQAAAPARPLPRSSRRR